MADYSSYKIALGYTGDWSVPQHAHIDATEDIATEVETARNGQASLTAGLAATYQPKDATLTALAGVTTAADKLIYATGVDTFSTTTLAAAGRTFLATPSSANLATLVSDETGSGSLVFATSPTLVTPALGVATATSVNKVAVTAPATSATLTLANGSTLATSGAYSTTLTATGATNVTLPTTGTLATLAGTETLTNKTLTSPTISGGTINNATIGATTPATAVVTSLGVGKGLSAWKPDLFSVIEFGDADSQGFVFSQKNDTAVGIGINYYYDDTSSAKYFSSGYSTQLYQYAGDFLFRYAPNNTSGAGAALTYANSMTLKASGNLLLGTDTDTGAKLQVNGSIISKPQSTVTLSNNGEMSFELTSNTSLKVKVRGSDGVTRSATLTLA